MYVKLSSVYFLSIILSSQEIQEIIQWVLSELRWGYLRKTTDLYSARFIRCILLEYLLCNPHNILCVF